MSKTVTAFAAAVVVCVLAPGQALAQDIIVPDDFLSINAAIAAASSGDEIMVRSSNSPYQENVVIDKVVRVYSEDGPALTAITGSLLSVNPLPVRFTGVWGGPGSPAHLEGFTVENTKGPATLPIGTFEAGIYVDPFAAPKLLDVWVTGNADHGIVHACSGGYFENVWVFANGNALTDGGGIYAEGNSANSPLSIVSSLIENNVASNGGGLYAEPGTGGSCWVGIASTGTTYRDNVAGSPTGGGSGGGAYITAQVTSFGGAAASFNFNHFDGNTAMYRGGGLHVQGAIVDVNDSLLEGNQATQGGGAAIATTTAGAHLRLNRATLEDNTAANTGGGVYTNNGQVTAVDCVLAENEATTNGGGGFSGAVQLIGAVPSPWAFTRTLFDTNLAGADGGGLQNNAGIMTLTDCIVTDNLAGANGGGVTTLSSGAGGGFASTTVTGGSIVDNDATQQGGGVFNAGQTNMTDVQIDGNTALEEGGGVAFVSSFGNIMGGSVSDNTADFAGAGIYMDNPLDVGISDATIDSNKLASGGFGGGVCIDGGPFIGIQRNVISNNTADFGAGAWVDINFSQFGFNRLIGNTATVDGGGAYLDLHNDQAVGFNTFGGNQASGGDGGGVYLAGTSNPTIILARNILIENTAPAGSGGNAYLATSTNFWNNDVICGDAPTGGGVYIAGSNAHAVDVRNNIIQSNDADGVESAGAATVTVDYNTVWMNNAVAFVAPLAAGTNGMAVDPLWAGAPSCDLDFTNDVFNLDSTSSLIDQGDTATAGPDPEDGSANDIGAIGGNDSCFVDLDGDGDYDCTDCDDSNPTLNTNDDDGDGVDTCNGDCDDADPNNFPGNPEICDGQDNDCTFGTEVAGEYTNTDGDPAVACADCADTDPDNYPGNPEVCDGQDNDCDGSPGANEGDSDGDGFIDCDDCNPVVGTICQDSSVCPRICGDGIDQDCNGVADDSAACGCPAGDPCDDGDPCTESDVCDNAGTCAGKLKDCNDTNVCTVDSCDGGGNCVNAPSAGTSCDDGDPCTDNDVCDDSGGCAGAGKTCDDSNGCTVDSCDAGGNCVNAPDAGAVCDDSNACTDNDVCDGSGACAGVAKSCDDSNGCTVDSCDAGGNCVNTPDTGASCDDGNVCTDNDLCDGSGGCAGSTKDCDDSDLCTTDSCDGSGTCVNDPVVCPVGEMCVAGGCVGVADPAPDAAPDAGADTTPDVVPDAVADTGPDALPDAVADATPDTVADVAADAGADAPVADVAADAPVADVAADAPVADVAADAPVADTVVDAVGDAVADTPAGDAAADTTADVDGAGSGDAVLPPDGQTDGTGLDASGGDGTVGDGSGSDGGGDTVVADAAGDATGGDATGDAAPDAGGPDAGQVDVTVDTGGDATADAGSPDGGAPDASVDGGSGGDLGADVVTIGGGGADAGCDCEAGNGGVPMGELALGMAIIGLLWWRRRSFV